MPPGSSAATRRLAGSILGGVWALAIVAVTMAPDAPANAIRSFLCLTCSAVAAADALRNVALFVPLGVCLALRGAGVAGGAAVGLLFSATLEALQAVIPGRTPSLLDILSDGTGAALGVLLCQLGAARSRLSPRALDRGVAVSAALWIAALAAHGWLAMPSLSGDAPWHGEYAIPVADAPTARVESAQVGEHVIAAGALPDVGELRSLVAGGTPIRVDLVPGRREDALAPWFTLADARQRELLMIGSNGDALIYRLRTRGRASSFEATDLRADGFLDGAWGDAPLAVAIGPGADGLCFERDGQRRCGLGMPAGRAWSHVVPMLAIPESWRLGLDFVWLAASGIPCGFFLRRSRSSLVAAAALALAFAALPVRIGLRAATPAEALALAAGLALGGAVARGLAVGRQHAHARSIPLRS